NGGNLMSITHKQFAEYLLCFGTEPGAWPEPLRDAAREAAKTPEGAALLADHQRFEAALNARRLVPARSGLAGRIAAECRSRPQNTGIFQWCMELFRAPMLPRPAFSLAMALALGLIIGFSGIASLRPAEYAALEQLADEGTVP